MQQLHQFNQCLYPRGHGGKIEGTERLIPGSLCHVEARGPRNEMLYYLSEPCPFFVNVVKGYS